MDKTLEISEEEKKERILKRKEFELPQTRFNFINDHFGFRKGKVHTLISPSGSGKSTLTRSLLLDAATKIKACLYSTEEDFNDTTTMISMRNYSNDVLKNITFIHEGTDIAKKINLDEWIRILEVNILNSKSEILFFDNLTTSDFYEPKKPDEQALVFSELRSLSARLNIPIFIIAHTASTVKDDQQGLIRAEDVWGSKSPARKSQFLYIYQRLIGKASQTGETTPSYGIIRVVKARGYDTHEIYLLNYKHENSEYFGDVKIPNNKFKEIYDSRFKL